MAESTATLPGYRARAGGAWIDVRAARFVVGSSPRADLLIAGAPRHLRLELGTGGAIVRAIGGPVAIGGVAVLVAPVGDAVIDAGGVRIEIEPAAPWAPPGGEVPGLDAASPLRRLAIAAIAAAATPLLIEGEPGAGATTAARAAHRGGPLIEVDAGASVDVVEPRLFGAAMARLGLGGAGTQTAGGAFAEARGGTLLLERVDALDPSLHTRLLAALDRHDDVRVIATARDLDASDLSPELIDRLTAARAWLPTLAAAPEDLFAFARRFADEVGLETPRDLPRILGARPWQRNLAELRAFLARMATAARDDD